MPSLAVGQPHLLRLCAFIQICAKRVHVAQSRLWATALVQGTLGELACRKNAFVVINIVLKPFFLKKIACFQKTWGHFKYNRQTHRKITVLTIIFRNKNLPIDLQCFRLLRPPHLCSSLNTPQTGICLTRFNQYCWWCVWGRRQLKLKLLPGPLEHKTLQEKNGLKKLFYNDSAVNCW